MAYAQTQLGAGISPAVAAPAAAPAIAAAAAPAVAARAAAVVAPAAPIEVASAAHADAFAPRVAPALDAADDGAPDPFIDDDAPQPKAARKPVLRYDDSMPELPKQNPLGDKRTVMIAGGAIGVLCLILVFVLMAKMCN